VKIGLLKTSLATFVVLFGLLAYGIALFGVAAPATMFQFTYDMGLRRASAMYADMMYSRSPTEENRYRALDFAIEFGRSERVIELFSRQYNIDEDEHLNATNWHRGQFVWALLELGYYDEALDFLCFSEKEYRLINDDCHSILSRPCFVYFVFENHSTTGIPSDDMWDLQVGFYNYIRAFDMRVAAWNADVLAYVVYFDAQKNDIIVHFQWFVELFVQQHHCRVSCPPDCNLSCV